MAEPLYSISDVARCFDTPVSTLRYYDELGLLPAAARRGRVRFYDLEQLRKLALIQCLHGQGMVSLADTISLLRKTPTDSPVGRELLTASFAGITQRIEALRVAQRLLEHLLSCPRANPVQECEHLQAELDDAVASALTGIDGGHRSPAGSTPRTSNTPATPPIE